ncbi:MAG: ABC transporter permease [Clostridiaceae bacterium]|nr:ABC transporter permease [Clostridiaceae bacterium]
MKYIANFLKYKYLLHELVSRDIKTKYRRSVLGLLWTVLNPMLMMLVLTFVFSKLFRFDIENFPVYLLCGQLIFNYFADSTANAMNAIIFNASLIKKVYVPHYMFPLSRVASSLISMLASYCAMIIVILVTKTPLYNMVLLSFIPIVLVALFSTGVGLFLSALAVQFRDVVHLYSVFLTALTYVTPVFYPISILPEKVRRVVEMNPMTVYIEMFRDLMMHNTFPDAFTLAKGVIFCIVSLTVGLYVFYKRHDSFILYI